MDHIRHHGAAGVWQRCHAAGRVLMQPSCQHAKDKQQETVDIATVTLDDPTLVPPGRHIFCRHRVPWLQLADSLPCQEGDHDGA